MRRATMRLKQGRVETPVGFGHMVLQRVGSGADIGLVALIAPAPCRRQRLAPASERLAPACGATDAALTNNLRYPAKRQPYSR